ncbi:MAG TPA: hypothetical protein VKG26_03380 [Bacteroidia bacterium]|nr:hypothetical protein [Bacteroidia bacterium]
MKKTSIILAALLFVGVASVKAQQPDPKQVKKENTSKKEKYALEISFISIGSGIDVASFQKIDDYIKNHPKKPAVNVVQKGREGERIMYLKLDELSKKEKHEFVKEVEKLIVNKDLVKVKRNFELDSTETKQ